MKNDYDIAAIYREMELHLIRSLKRNLGRHLTDEIAEGFKWKAWQAEKLKELKRYQRQNKDIINAYLSGLDDDIAEILKDEFSQGALHELNKYNELFDKNMSDSFFKLNDRKVNALIKSVNNDMQTADKAVLRMMNDIYRQTIHKAAMFANNGVMTQKQAVDMATKDFLSRGLNVIEYKDGKRVNIASYSQMAVRTASQRAMLIGQGEFRKEIGENLVIISKHGTACKLCQPHESKVYIDDVYANGKPDGKHKLLSQAMKEGLFHPNCRHGIGTYYDLDDEDEKETTKLVPKDNNDDDVVRKQRQLDKYKRLAAGSQDKKNIDKYQLTMDQYLNELKVEEYNKTALNSLIQKSDIKDTKTITPDLKKFITAYTSGNYDIACTYSQMKIDGISEDKIIERLNKYNVKFGETLSTKDLENTKNLMNTIEKQDITTNELVRLQKDRNYINDKAHYESYKVGDTLNWGIKSTTRDTNFAQKVFDGVDGGVIYREDVKYTEFRIIGDKRKLDIDQYSPYDQAESLIMGKFEVLKVEKTEPQDLKKITISLDEFIDKNKDRFENFTSKKGKEMVRDLSTGKTYTQSQAKFSYRVDKDGKFLSNNELFTLQEKENKKTFERQIVTIKQVL